MASPDGSPPSWGSSDVVGVRAEALDVVSDIDQWRLADARWQAIDQVLAAMAAALETDDLEALAAATAELELAGPVRITRIGATPVVPPPPQVRDRLNLLVHALGGTSAGERDEPE
jgi:hypothetical protein